MATGPLLCAPPCVCTAFCVYRLACGPLNNMTPAVATGRLLYAPPCVCTALCVHRLVCEPPNPPYPPPPVHSPRTSPPYLRGTGGATSCRIWGNQGPLDAPESEFYIAPKRGEIVNKIAKMDTAFSTLPFFHKVGCVHSICSGQQRTAHTVRQLFNCTDSCTC